jgi:hypothetical protein
MTSRLQSLPGSASLEARLVRGVVAAGLRLRLSRELTMGLSPAPEARTEGAFGTLLQLSYVSHN